ncbi:MAG: C4-type zinc ribbon domain-containing protein [Kiritimatiellia bacterium]
MIDKLLELQERDIRISQIERELRDNPARKEQMLSRMGDSKTALQEARDKLKVQQSRIKGYDLEIESRREKIKKLLTDQGSLKSNKEYQAMTGQIRAVELEINKIEDQILGIWDLAEAHAAEVKAKENDLKGEDSVVQQDVMGLDARIAELQKELDGLKAERQALAAGVDSRWLVVYERIMAKKKDKALVEVTDGVCGGCHMSLPPYQKHEARKRADIITCTFCGRMLYA